MGFLSGLGQFAANAVAPTLNVAAARAQAQRAEEDSQRQQMIQAVLLQKQLEQARIDNALKAQQTVTSAATAGYRGAQEKALGNQKLSRVPVMINGKPDFAFDDGHGNLVDRSGNPVGGDVKPYQAPPQIVMDSQRKDPSEIPGTPEWYRAKKMEKDLNAPRYVWAVPPTGGKAVFVTQEQAAQGGYSQAPAGSGGGQSLSLEDRAKMLNQAKIDNATMKRVEARVLSGDLKFGTGAGLATAAAGAHGSPMNEAMGVLGNAAAGAMDPDIQQYITANDSYSRIMGNLQSKRYTDNQAGIEKRISGLKGNDLKNTILYKQTLRDASIDDPDIQPATLQAAPMGGGRAGGGQPVTAKPAKAGVASKYGITPSAP